MVIFLGFQVDLTSPVRYQWRKNKEPLSDNEFCSNTHSAILFISSVGKQTKGKYNCHVSYNFGEIESADIYLLPELHFPEITKHFIALYTEMDDIPKDSWPPVTNTEFVSLALIAKNKQIKDYYSYAVQSDMDDIIAAKENVECEEVFGRHENGTLLLVEGRPCQRLGNKKEYINGC